MLAVCATECMACHRMVMMQDTLGMVGVHARGTIMTFHGRMACVHMQWMACLQF